MSKQNIDYKRKMQAKKVSRKNKMRKVFATSAAASLLAFNTLPAAASANTGSTAGNALTNPNISTLAAITNVAPFASLAEVQLLSNVNVDATLTDSEDPNFYNLALNLSGNATGVQVIDPEKNIIFYADELAGKLSPNGTATVQVDLLPLNLEQDFPGVYNLVGTVTEGLSSTVQQLVNLVNANPLWTVNGLEDLTASLDVINNLNVALQDLTSYTDEVEVTVGPNGELVVNISNGLGQYLETAIQDLVVQALNDIIDAINNLSISGPGSSLANPVLDTLSGLVTTVVQPAINDVGDGVIDIANVLGSAQVLGTTNVSLNALLDNPAGVSGDVDVYGAGVQTAAIDLQLLTSLNLVM